MRARVFAPDVLLRGMSGRVFGMRARAFLSGIGSEFPFRKSIFYSFPYLMLLDYFPSFEHVFRIVLIFFPSLRLCLFKARSRISFISQFTFRVLIIAFRIMEN